MSGAEREYVRVDCGGLSVPLLSRVVNLGLDSFVRVRDRIDAISGAGIEWDKIPILINEPTYLEFLARAGATSVNDVVRILGDFAVDTDFRAEMEESLGQLAATDAPGDLRFHAITLYCLVRMAMPDLIVETGVAHGKSSAFLLLGLEHNGGGSLISVDLPPDGNLADGSRTAMYERSVGWLVPDRLRARWAFLAGDSLEVLPRVLREAISDGRSIGMFFHDSLHTFEHTLAELDLVAGAAAGERMLVCVDNIDMGSGPAYDSFLASRGSVAFAFRDFAAGWVDAT